MDIQREVRVKVAEAGVPSVVIVRRVQRKLGVCCRPRHGKVKERGSEC